MRAAEKQSALSDVRKYALEILRSAAQAADLKSAVADGSGAELAPIPDVQTATELVANLSSRIGVIHARIDVALQLLEGS